MRVIVCGGRDFTDRDFIYTHLDQIHQRTPITTLVHGDARGTDRIAEAWAIARQIRIVSMPAEWTKYGRSAGPIRNKHMLMTKPDAVIAFPGGRGTKNMLDQAFAAKVALVITPVKE